MHERRPYQIVFEREGIHACAFSFPQDEREDFLKHLKELRTPPPAEEIDRQTAVRTEITQEDFATAPAGSARRPAGAGRRARTAPAVRDAVDAKHRA